MKTDRTKLLEWRRRSRLRQFEKSKLAVKIRIQRRALVNTKHIGNGQGKARGAASTLSARTTKKTKLRESINRKNRKRFATMGLLNVCEARLVGCWPNGDLTWAHGRKDRHLTMEEREFLVIRACTCCHRIMDEEMGHEGMLKFVESVIAQRKVAA
jgi:hypothetical protein